MRALIIKDFITLRKQAKLMGIIVLFYIAYSVMVDSVSMITTMVILLCSMLPVTSMSYDEYCKWDKYALTLPISRKDITVSKYMLSLLLELIAVVILTPVNLVMVSRTGEMSTQECLLNILFAVLVGILFVSIMLPILYKFGVEKGRMVLMLVILVPVAVAFILAKLNISMPSGATLEKILYFVPAAVILLFTFSMLLSIHICSKKEY